MRTRDVSELFRCIATVEGKADKTHALELRSDRVTLGRMDESELKPVPQLAGRLPGEGCKFIQRHRRTLFIASHLRQLVIL